MRMNSDLKHWSFFSNRQATSLPGRFRLDTLDFKCYSQGRINSKFWMRAQFRMRPKFMIRFDFSVKHTCNFKIRLDFGLTPNFRIKFDFSFGKDTLNSTLLLAVRWRCLWPSLSTPNAIHSNPNGLWLVSSINSSGKTHGIKWNLC